MVEEIIKGIYRIPVPLPNNPLRELNSYVIKGEGRTLVVDTGFRLEACRQALFQGLSELHISPEETDVLLTHLHSDHAGLAAEVASRDGQHIYVSRPDRELLDFYASTRAAEKNPLESVQLAQGFSVEQVDTARQNNPALTMAPPVTDRYRDLEDGALLDCGNHQLKAILVPGHTPGQMCFWIEQEGLMLLGDHVLFDITPNITAWPGIEDALGDYLNSLKAIRRYDVDIPLPGHRKPGNFKQRIDTLISHHYERLDEALSVVKAHPGETAYQLAGYMTWKIRSDTWETFPMAQKWFAVGECASHMDYLIAQRLVKRETDSNGVNHYYPD